MPDESVTQFYTKNAAEGYLNTYDVQHGPRLDAMVAQWDLKNRFAGKKVVDVGGGLGFLGKRLDESTDYWVIDGAKVRGEDKLCKGHWASLDIDLDPFGVMTTGGWYFDAAFCLETLEHLTNPYHCLAEIKKLVKPDGDIYISLPHENVWHNAVYPALLWPEQNWEQFLGQMALPIKERWMWTKGWNARHWWTKNRPYSEKVMLYPKQEAKFLNATPIEMVNW